MPARFIQYVQENGTFETDVFRVCFWPDEVKELSQIMYTDKGKGL